MKKTRIRILVLVLLLSLAVATVAFARDKYDMKRLDIRNKSEEIVTLVLVSETNGQTTYVLNVPAFTRKVFTVYPDLYAQTTYACSDQSSGTLDIGSNTRLTFTHCFNDAPNAGEPTQEKVHIDETPDGIKWYYQHDR
jgi:hypothetical protein